MVSISLQHCNQSLGSSTQSCMQGHYWVPFFYPLFTTPSWGPTSSSKANSETPDPLLLWTCSAPPPKLLQPLCPGNKKRSMLTKEETLLEIILFFGHTTTPIPTWDSDHVPPFSPMDYNPLNCFPLHSRLQSASSRLSSLPPSDIQVWTDGSVPSLFGPGGAGVYVTCSKCNTSNSLSFSSGPIASSFTAETFALKQG